MSSSLGVLLIHGFAGARSEVQPLYDVLQKNFPVSMPRLAGHEGTKKELASTSRFQWIASAEEALFQLQQQCHQIAVIGFSMGGLIAIRLCQMYPITGLITVNTPIYYWNLPRIFYNLKQDFPTYSKKYFLSGANKPFRALWEFQRILQETKPLVSNVSCPALVIQTQDDDVVQPRSAHYLTRHLKGETSFLPIKKGGHVVLPTSSFSDIEPEITSFLQNQIILS